MKTEMVKENVLKSIEEELKSADVAAIYVKADEEDGIGIDVLTALFDDVGADSDEVAAEIMFLPDEGEAEFLYFVCSMVFSEDVPDAFIGNVREAATRANYYISTGAFSCENNTLVFRTNTTLPADIPEEKIIETCKAVTASAISLTNMFVRPMLRLSEGNMTVEDALEGLI